MTERELLELAAKAAGVNFRGAGLRSWNPLLNDGEALRLAVALRLSISAPHHDINGKTRPLARSQDLKQGVCCNEGNEVINDPFEATRRAIVCAAAEIGKRMEKDK